MSRQPGEAKGRSSLSMFSRKIAGLFAAAALAIPVGQALAHESDHGSRYAGELVTLPPHSARADTTLNIKPSATQLSRRIESLQQRFGNILPDVRLVVMDKDWFQQNSILNGGRAYQYAPDPAQSATIRRMISEYVRARGNLAFDPASFEGLERDVLRTEGMAIKFGYGDTRDGAQTSGKNICLLFPHFADQSRDQYYDTLIGRSPSVNGNIANAPLRDPMDYEYMKRFVDYHEIGHCFDRWYIKNINMNNPQSFLENRHKAEVFGEVFANLMLARDGYTQFSQKQADLRLAIAAFNGPASAAANGIDNLSFYMTYAYLLHEGSRNAGREIERLGAERLQALSMDEVLNLAHDITERSTFDINEMAPALAFMMATRYDAAELESLRQSGPEAQRGYDVIARLKADMEGAVRRVFDFGNRTEPVLQPSSFNFSNPPGPRLGASVLEARARELGQEMRNSLGWMPSETNLIRVYQQKKDALRQVLETGNAQAQFEARRDLSLMQMAFKHAYDALPRAARLDYSIKWDMPLLKQPA